MLVKWFIALSLTLLPSLGYAIQWNDNYQNAVERAKQENKPLFVFFTGSDWCTWCKKLESEVLNTREFDREVGNSFIFVKLDFPRQASNSPDQARNESLRSQFGVSGFPTVVILNNQAQKVGTLGYQKGGPMSYAATVKRYANK